MFVAKLDPTGTTLIYSTFLSATGSGTSITEYATGVACDAGDVIGICVTEDNGATVNPTNVVCELDITRKD